MATYKLATTKKNLQHLLKYQGGGASRFWEDQRLRLAFGEAWAGRGGLKAWLMAIAGPPQMKIQGRRVK